LRDGTDGPHRWLHDAILASDADAGDADFVRHGPSRDDCLPPGSITGHARLDR
jgi:hypothetical protein